ncbi:TatD family hydrolase [Rubinisphaera brasiliensis]|uniref:Hydrolase, TatD family n=1 Tax=Rubinisphaera brasiliensis (strain ATCC 49424 / DSM 5305 / JCM 21570 / IAM 15109 / NBRC 103401 / IFAM 1448) TaxID=756272 RepID=F0SKK0_RUBBR|nr:TatD family hydrolase [Rubinisphaera brasiliensis]ADY61981.1 hydrolase, TatD family [Rubinisphaera brasiliensis DSM 5305]
MNYSAPLFDSHAHLDEPSLRDDRAAVLEAARENGLEGILTIGTTRQSSLDSVALAAAEPMVFAAVGIHPNYVAEAQDSDWTEIEKLAESPDVKALGETGLDRYWKHTPIESQIDFFKRHIQLSRKLSKPFIVHCRDADDDVLAVMAEFAADGPLQGVMHSFCGSREMATQCVEWGMMISFSGMLTFKRNQELRDLAAEIPADRLMVETDCPYLAPVPFRGKRNQPAYVKHVAEVLADVRNARFDETCQLTTANARRFFGIA